MPPRRGYKMRVVSAANPHALPETAHAIIQGSSSERLIVDVQEHSYHPPERSDHEKIIDDVGRHFDLFGPAYCSFTSVRSDRGSIDSTQGQTGVRRLPRQARHKDI